MTNSSFLGTLGTEGEESPQSFLSFIVTKFTNTYQVSDHCYYQQYSLTKNYGILNDANSLF